MNKINFEIKARCRNTSNIRKILRLNNAVYKSKDYQIDTYFKVNRGRLKLREGEIENYLIYYEREDKKGPKQSEVILFEIEKDSSLKQLLTKALGMHIIVEKQREIYFIDNVKFHIDKVKDLGFFVEIEAIGDGENVNLKELKNQCGLYLQLLKISGKDLISLSYCELMLNLKLY